MTDNLEVVWEDLKFNFIPVIVLCCYFFIFLSSPGFSCTLWLNAFMCITQGYSRRGNEFLITLCTTWQKCLGEYLEFLQIGVLALQMFNRRRDALKGTALNLKSIFQTAFQSEMLLRVRSGSCIDLLIDVTVLHQGSPDIFMLKHVIYQRFTLCLDKYRCWKCNKL